MVKDKKIEYVECVCGGDIRKIELPVEAAKLIGEAFIWTHSNGNIYCYDHCEDCTAEPYDNTYVGLDGNKYIDDSEVGGAVEERILKPGNP